MSYIFLQLEGIVKYLNNNKNWVAVLTDHYKMDELDKDQLSSKKRFVWNSSIKNCILVLQQTFDAFDVDNKGYIETDMIGTIMDMLGTRLTTDELEVTSNLYWKQIDVIHIFTFRK